MTQLTALLVDDERLARAQLREKLAHFPDLQVVADADSVARAVEAVERVRPDVVFLDIQMPGSTGFDFLERATGNFKVIFVTAFDQFALRAFDVNALDYLLKPVRLERLSAAIDRLSQSSATAAANRAAPSSPPLEYSDYLFVSSGAGAQFLRVRAIKYIVAAGSYSEVFAADGRKWLLLQPLKDWEDRLPPAHFARTHRSCIVNLEYVDRIESLANDTFQVHLRGQADPLPMSRRCSLALKHRFR